MITRDLEAARSDRHDLVVVGGGVHGCMLALQASLRGLRVVLLERGDFGEGTSWNSLRILHGGLRYLQTLDLVRFKESVRERRWFFETFPRLVRPLPCVMPLSGRGLRRPGVLRAVLGLNDLLSGWQNRGVPTERRLPASRVLPPGEITDRLPEAGRRPVRGGALWYDGVMVSPQRILVELLARTGLRGSLALNYVEARSLLRAGDRVAGVRAAEVESEIEMEIRAPVVVNAAGPDCLGLARRMDRQVSELFRPSLAFNLLLDRSLDAEVALAVYADAPGARTYFLLPFHGRILAGTFHEPMAGGPVHRTPMPDRETLGRALDDLNAALPGLGLAPADVVYVLPGYLPARETGSTRQARRSVVVDHGARGGPVGFWSMSGVKFTTARAAAERTLDRIGRSGHLDIDAREEAPAPPDERRTGDAPADPQELLHADAPDARAALERIVREEAVLHLDDLLLRRLDGLRVIDRTGEVGRDLCRLLGWDAERTEEELARLDRAVAPRRPGGRGRAG